MIEQQIIEKTRQLCTTVIPHDGNYIIDSSLILELGDLFVALALHESETELPLVTGYNYNKKLSNESIKQVSGISNNQHLVNLSEVIFINLYNFNGTLVSLKQMKRDKTIKTYCEKQYILDFLNCLNED